VNWEEIRKEYETSNITLKALADKHDIKIGTLKSRKSREGWERDATKKDATQPKKVATPKEDAKQPNSEIIESLVESEGLTDKQRLFCMYYVKTFNATQSAIKAGYAPDSAHVRGHELLRNSKVAAEIRRIKSNMANDVFIDAMDVLNKWVKIAFADITDYVRFGQREQQVIGMYGPVYEKDEEGKADKSRPVMETVNYIDFENYDRVDGTIISEVKQGKDGVSIKLEDKMKALDKLSLYFDLFPDKFKREIESEKLKIAQMKVDKGDDDKPIEILIKRK